MGLWEYMKGNFQLFDSQIEAAWTKYIYDETDQPVVDMAIIFVVAAFLWFPIALFGFIPLYKAIIREKMKERDKRILFEGKQ